MTRKSLRWVILISITILMISLTGCKACKERVAVLISTHNVNADDIGYFSVWWYDTVLMNELLENEDYDRIYILYGNGTDFASKHDCYNSTTRFGHTITDFPCDRAHIEAIFDKLGNGGTIDGNKIQKLKNNSRLFVWWMGHGGGTSTSSYSMLISHTGEHVSGNEFKTWVNYITNYGKRSIHVMTCHAGCYLPLFDVSGNTTIAESSSDCLHSSYEHSNPPDVNHAEYTYWLYSSLRGKEPDADPDATPCLGVVVPSDTNGDGKVSLEESFNHIVSKMLTSAPKKVDPDSIASSTFCK